ncbi:MAG: YybS family protein [Solobacterium sp.]|jgi:hypothetical protein|nr:YybS family protein [Solobacterium sp.]MCH4226394.1 YybS family protein [Solobacterium sp.]MCH4282384.1 YybS family protein [Solobacterium sp.]
MKNDVRKMTDGAMMAAIMGAVLLIDRQTAGLLQATVLFLYPLPLVFYGAKYGWKSSWMVFAAIVMLAAVIDTPATVLTVAGEAFVGMVYGCGIYAKTDMKRILLRTVIVSVVMQVLITIVFAEFFGYDLMAEASEMEGIYSQMLSSMGGSLPSNMNLEEIILAALMASVILTGVLEALILHLIAKMMFKRMHITVPASMPLTAYIPPKWSGYAGIAGAACFFIATSSQVSLSSGMRIALQGIGMCGGLYLVFYGLIAAAVYSALHTGGSRFLIMAFAVLMLMMAWYIVALIGFLYITTDMHHKMMQRRFQHE